MGYHRSDPVGVEVSERVRRTDFVWRQTRPRFSTRRTARQNNRKYSVLPPRTEYERASVVSLSVRAPCPRRARCRCDPSHVTRMIDVPLGTSVTHVPPVEQRPVRHRAGLVRLHGCRDAGPVPRQRRQDPVRRDEPGLRRHAPGAYEDRLSSIPRSACDLWMLSEAVEQPHALTDGDRAPTGAARPVPPAASIWRTTETEPLRPMFESPGSFFNAATASTRSPFSCSEFRQVNSSCWFDTTILRARRALWPCRP